MQAKAGKTNEALKTARINKKMTMQKIADLVGCTKSSYGNIEKGRRSPSLEMAQRLAATLNSSVDALFGTIKDDSSRD